MRRASTRFWLSVSCLLLASAALGSESQESAKKESGQHHANELTLAGLRPGQNTLRQAVLKYGASKSEESGTASWHDVCRGHTLSIIAGDENKIQTIRVSDSGIRTSQDCSNAKKGAGPSRWITGRGLSLGDPVPRVESLYGKPDSESPCTKNGEPLELLYYAFDWAGPDVPQVMEVVCTPKKNGKPGRVVEITLAAPSL